MIIRQHLIRTVEFTFNHFDTLFLLFLTFVSTAFLEFSHQLSTSLSFTFIFTGAMNLQIEFIEFFDCWLTWGGRKGEGGWGWFAAGCALQWLALPRPRPPPSSCTLSASSMSTTCWYHHSAFVAWSFIWFPDLSSVNAMSKSFVLNQVHLFE